MSSSRRKKSFMAKCDSPKFVFKDADTGGDDVSESADVEVTGTIWAPSGCVSRWAARFSSVCFLPSTSSSAVLATKVATERAFAEATLGAGLNVMLVLRWTPWKSKQNKLHKLIEQKNSFLNSFQYSYICYFCNKTMLKLSILCMCNVSYLYESSFRLHRC